MLYSTCFWYWKASHKGNSHVYSYVSLLKFDTIHLVCWFNLYSHLLRSYFGNRGRQWNPIQFTWKQHLATDALSNNGQPLIACCSPTYPVRCGLGFWLTNSVKAGLSPVITQPSVNLHKVVKPYRNIPFPSLPVDTDPTSAWVHNVYPIYCKYNFKTFCC